MVHYLIMARAFGARTGLGVAMSLLALTGSGAYLLRAYQPISSVASAYTITQADSSTVLTRGSKLSRTLVAALRSDGAQMRGIIGAIDKTSNGFESRRIFLPHDGKVLTVADPIGALSTEYFTPKTQTTAAALPDRCQPNGSASYIGLEQVLGFRTFKYHETVTLDDGRTADSTRWYAAALHCAAVQSRMLVSRNGVEVERNETVPVSIVVGEPNASLFEVAANYREMAPSARQIEQAAHDGITNIPDSAKKSMDFLDQKYHKAQRTAQ